MNPYLIRGFGFLYPESTLCLDNGVYSVKASAGPYCGTIQLNTMKNEIFYGTLSALYDSFPIQRQVYIDERLFAFARSLKKSS